MDWEKKFNNIIRETDSNLAQAKNKLNSSLGRSMQFNTYKNDLVNPGDEASSLLLYNLSRPAASDSYSTVSRPALTSQPLQISTNSMHSTDNGLIGSSDKIYRQNVMVEELTRRLQQSERDREMFSGQLQQLRYELTALQCQPGANTTNPKEFITREVFDRWRGEVSNELKIIHKNIDEIKQEWIQLKRDTGAAEERFRFKQATKQLQKIVEEECLSLRNDLISTSCRLAKLESDLFDVCHFQSATARTTNRSMLYDEIDSRTSVEPVRSSKTVGFNTPNLSSSSPDSLSPTLSTTLTHLRDKYKTLKQTLKNLDGRMDENSDNETETGVTTTVASYASPMRLMNEDPLTSISPATSDIDVSMLTTELESGTQQITSSRRPGAHRASDYINTEDITTDVSLTDDCISLDDL